MKLRFVASALVAVMCLMCLAPVQRAEANPLIFMGVIKLADYLLQKGTREIRSDVGSLTVANLWLDDKVVAGTPTADMLALVVPRCEGHEVKLLVDTQADVVPSVCSDFTEIRVGCNGAPDFTITPQDAAKAAGWRMNLGVTGGDKSWEKHEKDWVVPIDVNKLAFGQYLFRLDYYFKNGRHADSFAVFIHLFVTDLATLQEGVNSPDIQQVLRMTGGIWTPIPVMGTTDIPVSSEMARENGMAAAAEAAGIPRDGTVTRTRTEVGRVSYVSPPGTPPAPPVDGGAMTGLMETVGFGGNPDISQIFRAVVDYVPVVVILRSPDQQVTINGVLHQINYPGARPAVLARGTPGMTLDVRVNGQALNGGITPKQGLGLWLVAQ